MNLPEEIEKAVAPLFEAVPLANAMPILVGSAPKSVALVEQVLRDPALANRPDLAAGLWLYVDDLERSHSVSQSLTDATGAYWHGIMHRREGDYANGHYWMRRAANHPLLKAQPELDPDVLIDAVAQSRLKEDTALIARQRQEWAALFAWCANNG